MRPELNEIAEIEQYLEGTLSATEKAAFEARMNADAALRESVALQQMLTERIATAGLREAISQADQQYAGAAKTGLSKWIWGTATIVAVISIIAASVLFFEPAPVAETAPPAATEKPIEEALPEATSVLPENLQVPLNKYKLTQPNPTPL